MRLKCVRDFDAVEEEPMLPVATLEPVSGDGDDEDG
jgi:hypothetical protein